jgi:hypothetical protein
MMRWLICDAEGKEMDVVVVLGEHHNHSGLSLVVCKQLARARAHARRVY